MDTFIHLGDLTLLEREPVAFFCSTRCDGRAVLAAYEWARQQCDLGTTVICGFHTPVERDVYAILTRRGARIIHCLARSLPKRLAPAQRGLIEQGRLLLLTPFAPGTDRPTRQTCAERNRFAAQHARRIVAPPLDPASTLVNDLSGFELHPLAVD